MFSDEKTFTPKQIERIHKFLDRYGTFLTERSIRVKKTILESKQILKEIPILIKWVDLKFPKPPEGFETRLLKFGEVKNG